MKTIFSTFLVFAVLVLASVGVYAQDDAAEETPTSEVSCTASTPDARTVNVRVGPGENRTSVAFLPANVDVAVTGQAEDDDGEGEISDDRQ